MTHIKGFELFGLDLKKVAKRLAGKYACGCSVVKDNNGKEEIDLQGDFIDDLLEFIPSEFPEVRLMGCNSIVYLMILCRLKPIKLMS